MSKILTEKATTKATTKASTKAKVATTRTKGATGGSKAKPVATVRRKAKPAAAVFPLKTWKHIDEPTLEYIKSRIAEDEDNDVPMMYSESLARHFAITGDGKLWHFTGTHWVPNEPDASERELVNLIRASGGVFSMRKLEEIRKLTLRTADEISKPRIGINMTNGFLEFDHESTEWRLLPHSKAHGQTHVLPFEYVPGTVSQRWEDFLNTVHPDKQVHSYLQELFGYVLLGPARPHAECISVWVGNGANGKSVAQGVLRGLVGAENCSNLGPHQLTPRNMEQTVGKVVNIGSESERSDKLPTALLKCWSSGEPLLAEVKYRDHYQFTPTAFPMFAVNEVPPVDDRSDGIWRRLHLLKWDVSIPEEQRIENLGDRLREELTGIMNWALEGAKRVLQHGLSKPTVLVESTLEQRLESNSVAMFTSACVVRQSLTYISKDDAYKAYGLWCKLNGYKSLSSVNFGKELNRVEKNITDIKTRVGYINIDGVMLPGKTRVNAYSGIHIPAGRLQREVYEGTNRKPSLAAIGSEFDPQQLEMLGDPLLESDDLDVLFDLPEITAPVSSAPQRLPI